jgi:hypothetical protein
MRQRTASVAPGLGLTPQSVNLSWDVTHFTSSPGEVEAFVEYPVDFADLPIVGGLFPTVVRAAHVEWVDPFRSGTAAGARALGGAA